MEEVCDFPVGVVRSDCSLYGGMKVYSRVDSFKAHDLLVGSDRLWGTYFGVLESEPAEKLRQKIRMLESYLEFWRSNTPKIQHRRESGGRYEQAVLGVMEAVISDIYDHYPLEEYSDLCFGTEPCAVSPDHEEILFGLL